LTKLPAIRISAGDRSLGSAFPHVACFVSVQPFFWDCSGPDGREKRSEGGSSDFAPGRSKRGGRFGRYPKRGRLNKQGVRPWKVHLQFEWQERDRTPCLGCVCVCVCVCSRTASQIASTKTGKDSSGAETGDSGVNRASDGGQSSSHEKQRAMTGVRLQQLPE
jgi:hypothetical protein